MSGFIRRTGKVSNNGEKKLEIKNIIGLKIQDIVIHCIPLFNHTGVSVLRLIGKRLQNFVHPALSFTLSHVAIQLNMENDDIIIIEYGQYLTEDSNKKSKILRDKIFEKFESNCIDEARTDENDNLYYYINKDGARITKINKEKYFTNKENNKRSYDIISKIIASQYYHIDYDKFDYNISKMGIFNGFHTVECNISEQKTLGELIEYFKSNIWEAEQYNVLTHNCQDFAAQVIKILKAYRINEKDKIRINEKMILPNCIIKILWENEKLSLVNTIGRIPVVGMAFDIFAGFLVD